MDSLRGAGADRRRRRALGGHLAQRPHDVVADEVESRAAIWEANWVESSLGAFQQLPCDIFLSSHGASPTTDGGGSQLAGLRSRHGVSGRAHRHVGPRFPRRSDNNGGSRANRIPPTARPSSAGTSTTDSGRAPSGGTGWNRLPIASGPLLRLRPGVLHRGYRRHATGVNGRLDHRRGVLRHPAALRRSLFRREFHYCNGA